MKIPEIGGEFELIKRVTRAVTDPKVIVGVGDDAAVLDTGKKNFLLATKDMLVEEDHFSFKWASPFQVGVKAMESNVSDIAAMGGLPKYALVSFCAPKDIEVEVIEDLYKGLYSSAEKHGVEVIGGDSTHGKLVVVVVTVIGEVEKERLCLRSNAKAGEKILVTGDLGKSAAGLEVLLQGKKGFLKDHLEPKARVKEGRAISELSKCMIDVSDGLASEVKHLCEMSRVGAVVWKEKIPLSKTTIQNAELAGKNAFDLALNGGEDFELVFTLPENKISELKSVQCTVVGEILPKEKGVFLSSKGKKLPLGTGFNHFK